jgi:putative oxidoreductase
VGYLDRLQPLALLILRIVLGAIMIAHGYPKVFGGLHHHVQFVSSLGLPGWLAYVSAIAEFFGGILVIAGLVTRIAAFAIFIDLAVAIAKVHWKHGLTGQADTSFRLRWRQLRCRWSSSAPGPSRWIRSEADDGVRSNYFRRDEAQSPRLAAKSGPRTWGTVST